jgi:hypothetical protein
MTMSIFVTNNFFNLSHGNLCKQNQTVCKHFFLIQNLLYTCISSTLPCTNWLHVIMLSTHEDMRKRILALMEDFQG